MSEFARKDKGVDKASDGSAPTMNDESTPSNNESSTSNGNISNEAPTQHRPCRFFASGTCRSGDNCKFSHDLSVIYQNRPGGTLASQQSAAPPPTYVVTPVGAPIFSIDVECVATSVQHTGRSVAQVRPKPITSCHLEQ